MIEKRVDYDQIAPSYNQRFAADRPSGVAQALLDFIHQHQFDSILEIGCGTGHWLTKLALHRSHCFGLDLSRGMLQQAHHHNPSLSLVQGTAGQLSFAAEAFDWVYCVNAIHHFDQPDHFVSETYRVLRLVGWLAVIGSDPYENRERWFGYQYFPETYQSDLDRFPGEQQLAHWFAKAGFLGFERQVVEQISKLQSGRGVPSDPYLQKSSCSYFIFMCCVNREH